MKNNKGTDSNVKYMPIFMSIGISVGVAIGAAMQNIPLYMCIGLSIGVGIGAVIDVTNQRKDKSENGSNTESKDEDKE